MKWWHIAGITFTILTFCIPAAQSAGTESESNTYSLYGEFGLGFGIFRFSSGLSETGLAYNGQLGFRIYKQLSVAVEISGCSPNPRSRTALQQFSLAGLASVNVYKRLFLKAGLAFFSVEGNVEGSDQYWSGSDTSPSIMFGLGCVFPKGTHLSISPSVKWMRQNVDDSPGATSESGSDLITFTIGVRFH